MKRILLSIMLLFSVASLYAQGTPSEGKDYYLGFLYPSYNTVVPSSSSKFFNVYALISSFQDNTAYVSYFNDDGTEQAAQPYHIQARKAVQVKLSHSLLKISGDEIKEYKSVHITAKKPISVTFHSIGGCSGGMYLALPTNGLGTKYTIASYRDNPELFGSYVGNNGPSTADSSRGIYQIIGTQNGTTVTITNSGATTTSSTSRILYSIMLNRGQCYTVRSGNHLNTDDISGSIIESDKPIAVIAGHENAYIGGADNKPVEHRDYMVEQMIPYDYLDNTGYITIPMIDGAGITNGKGDNVRINVFKDTTNVTPYIITSGNPITANSQLKTYGTLQYSNIEYPSSFSAQHKISVVQYDMANHGSAAPYARPSMMTIVPRSRWRNAYMWYVPQVAFERIQDDYITVIAPKTVFDSIMISKNGQKEAMIKAAGMSQVSQYTNIPGHPDLKAIRYKLIPGSYYARASFPFMIYSYGYRSVANDIFGNFDGDDYYYSYATPLGMVLGSSDSSQMTITVDTLCTGWRICATDNHAGGGIKSAIIADDPFGDIFPYDAKKRGPYQYYNTSFTPDLDPNASREIIFSGANSTECFDVTVDNIGKVGYAPVFITDNNGNGKMIELYYKKAAIAYDPSPDALSSFGIQYILDVKDITFRFINNQSSEKPYLIEEIDLVKKNPAFEILSYTPAKPMPFSLMPGDTLSIKVRFTHTDTGYFSDSLLLSTECFSTYWPIDGTVGTGLIVASDHDFGNVVVGSVACTDTLTVRNVGNMPFTLTKDWKLFDDINFFFDTNRVRVGNRDLGLPQVISPGGYVKLYVCFKPTQQGPDSTDLLLKTDIRTPYEHTIKDVVNLKGRAIKPDVQWDVDTGYMRMDSARTRFMRRYLVNRSTAPIIVNDIFIQGTDASEFKIWGMQNPLEIAIDTGSSVWIDISVTADLTKPANYLRRAQVVATNTFDKLHADTLELVAGFDVLKVPQELQLEELTIYPNPTLGEDITASFGLTEPKELGFMVYDMLGREVLSVPASFFTNGKQSLSLPVSKLGEGVYILRVSDGVLTRSISFRVVK